MNEIENLYKNAGLDNLWVERYNDGNGFEHENWYPSYKVMIKSMMEKYGWTLMEAQNVTKKECQKEFPPFTAKKQLELIKWLVVNKEIFTIHYKHRFLYCCEEDRHSSACQENFEESLAALVNVIWQDLTEEEKQQIKEILNG